MERENHLILIMRANVTYEVTINPGGGFEFPFLQQMIELRTERESGLEPVFYPVGVYFIEILV